MKPHTFNGNNDTNFQLGYHSRLPATFVSVVGRLRGGLGRPGGGVKGMVDGEALRSLAGRGGPRKGSVVLEVGEG